MADVIENHKDGPITTPAAAPAPDTNGEASAENNDETIALEKELAALKEKIAQDRAQMKDKMLSDTASDLADLPRIKLKGRRTLNGHAAAIYTMSWRPDSYELVSGSQDGKLLIWDTQTNNKINIITMKCPWVMSSSFAASGSFVASGGHDNAVSIYSLKVNAPTDKPIQQLTDHTGFITSLQFIDDRQILAASGDNTTALWDIEGGQKITSYEGHGAEVMGICLSSDKSFFVSGSCDKTAKLWDIREKQAKQTFVGHDLDINSISMFPSNRSFVTGSDDNTCKLFDLRSDQSVAAYSPGNLNFGIAAVSFSKSGRLLFVACDFDVLICDALKTKRIGLLTGHEARVSCLGVNSDGNAMCSGSWDAKLKVWN